MRKVSMSETVDALHVKAVLEALAIRLANNKLKRRIPELRTYLKLILESALRHDYIEYQEQNQLFHRTIVEASENQILIRLWDSLAFVVRTRSIMDYLQSVDPYKVAKEHENILHAVESEHTEELASLLISHANRLVEHLQNQMAVNKKDVTDS